MLREYFDDTHHAWVVTDGSRTVAFRERPPFYITMEMLWEQPYLHGGTVVSK